MKTTIVNIMDDVEHVSAKEYFITFHAQSIEKVFATIWKNETNSLYEGSIPSTQEKAFGLASAQIQYYEKLSLPNEITQLLSCEQSKDRQISLLKGLVISKEQLATIFLYAEKLGYDFSHYRFEGYPKKYEIKDLPFLIHLRNETTEHIGKTPLSDGQLKEVAFASKFAIARILDNGKHWHCFYQTKRGICGKESGFYGHQSHIHYMSDAFGFSRNEFLTAFKSGNIPASKIHIILKDSKQI